MARTSNGTLEMKTDEQGLYTRATLNNTQQSRDVYEAVKRGDISQMSFAFTIKEDAMDTKTNTRTVKKWGASTIRAQSASPPTRPPPLKPEAKRIQFPKKWNPRWKNPPHRKRVRLHQKKPRKRFSLLKLIRRNLLPLKAKNRGK